MSLEGHGVMLLLTGISMGIGMIYGSWKNKQFDDKYKRKRQISKEVHHE